MCPLGINRTDANVPPHTSYRNGTPINEPVDFGTPITLPHDFGNPIPSDGGNVNNVNWPTPDPAHFGNVVILPQATPTFDPPAGAYVGNQSVVITSFDADAIYYTDDGSTPTILSTLYTGPVSVSTSETLKALAVKSGFPDSAIGSATYTITHHDVTLLSHTAASDPSASVTTSPIDTTGASLIVVATNILRGTPPLLTDSEGNTWQPLSVYGNAFNQATVQLYYCFGPTTSAAHTFTCNPTGGLTGRSLIAVQAFSNTKITSDVYEIGSDQGTSGPTPLVSPTITPSATGDLIVYSYGNNTEGLTALPIAVDSGFTITDQLENATQNITLAMAYLVSPDGSATAPTWTDQNDFNVFINRVNSAAFEKA